MPRRPADISPRPIVQARKFLNGRRRHRPKCRWATWGAPSARTRRRTGARKRAKGRRPMQLCLSSFLLPDHAGPTSRDDDLVIEREIFIQRLCEQITGHLPFVVGFLLSHQFSLRGPICKVEVAIIVALRREGGAWAPIPPMLSVWSMLMEIWPPHGAHPASVAARVSRLPPPAGS